MLHVHLSALHPRFNTRHIGNIVPLGLGKTRLPAEAALAHIVLLRRGILLREITGSLGLAVRRLSEGGLSVGGLIIRCLAVSGLIKSSLAVSRLSEGGLLISSVIDRGIHSREAGMYKAGILSLHRLHLNVLSFRGLLPQRTVMACPSVRPARDIRRHAGKNPFNALHQILQCHKCFLSSFPSSAGSENCASHPDHCRSVSRCQRVVAGHAHAQFLHRDPGQVFIPDPVKKSARPCK